MHSHPDSPSRKTPYSRRVGALAAVVLVSLGVAAATPAVAQEAAAGELRVFAYTLKHQRAHEALVMLRPLLSTRGTVEVQPGGNTLVIREAPAVIGHLSRLLRQFDRPPEDLRFDIRIVRAGPKRNGISPPAPESETEAAGAELPEDLAERLREYLRYDDYRVLAQAGLTSREGEEVTYSLGESYSVSFRPAAVVAGQRVKLEDFRIVQQVQNPTVKSRQLEPRELFHATLNLWIDRPFNLVLAQDESRQEALMVAISCRRESGDR